MIRKAFLDIYHLQYSFYLYAEDYKLWTQIAEYGGLFYIESLPLLFYRISSDQVSKQKNEEQQKTAYRITQEAFLLLLRRCSEKEISVEPVYKSLLPLVKEDVLTEELMLQILYRIMQRILN